MRFVLAIVIIVLVIIIVAAIVIAIAVFMQRRSSRRAAEFFGDADEIVRRWGDDYRPTRRLERLINDRRTPSSARKHLDRLARYRRSPIVLAPDWVPVLGWFNEGTIESFLLRQAFKTLPPELWAEYFPSTVPATSPARARARQGRCRSRAEDIRGPSGRTRPRRALPSCSACLTGRCRPGRSAPH